MILLGKRVKHFLKIAYFCLAYPIKSRFFFNYLLLFTSVVFRVSVSTSHWGAASRRHISIYELILIENAVSRCAPKSRVATNDRLIRNRGQVQIQFVFKEIWWATRQFSQFLRQQVEESCAMVRQARLPNGLDPQTPLRSCYGTLPSMADGWRGNRNDATLTPVASILDQPF